jgi:hypothetical protein
LCPAFSILSSFLQTLLCSSHWKKFCCQSSFFLCRIVTACHLLLANIARWCQDIPAVLLCLILYWISVKYWHCIGYMWNLKPFLASAVWLTACQLQHALYCTAMPRHVKPPSVLLFPPPKCCHRQRTFVKIALFMLSDAAADAFI